MEEANQRRGELTARVDASFTDIISSQKPFFSFEFFPPKKEADLASTKDLMRSLVKMGPAFMTVTYGAAGGTRALTRDLTAFIHNDLECPSVAHLTCVGHTVEEIDRLLDDLSSSGVRHVLALRGDSLPDSEDAKRDDAFSCARDLVSHISKRGDFSLAVAGYPEGHPDAESPESEMKYLASKVNAGSEIVFTQLFFEAQMYFDFVASARSNGITAPIVPGVLPIRSVKQVERFTKLCGASIPQQLQTELDLLRDDDAACRELGIRVATELSQALLEGGAPGIHFYTLNKSQQVQAVVGNLAELGLLERENKSLFSS